MDRQAILKQYSKYLDDDGAFISAVDALMSADKYYETKHTDFLTPDMASILKKICRDFSSLEVLESGGILNAERTMLVFVPYGFEAPDWSTLLSIVDVSYQEKFASLAHKDVLGALMGLGIKRKKVGDITPVNSGFQVAIDEALQTYVINTLDKVGRAGVKVKAVPLSMAAERKVTTLDYMTTVKSLRIDAVVAAAYSLSRADAQQTILSERVKVNHLVVSKLDSLVSEGDLVSVRGQGRFVMESILGLSKKDRMRVNFSMIVREGDK